MKQTVPNRIGNRLGSYPPSFVRTLLLSVLAIAALFAVDTSLARTEFRESQIEAQRFYQSGQRLRAAGKSEEAVEQFRAAFSVARERTEYQLAFIDALIRTDRWTEAKAQVAELLQRDANVGGGNLFMARILVREGNLAEASAYYHRAIYGEWPKDPLQRRVSVRFELVDLLAKQQPTANLLAELLPLEEEADTDYDTRMKLGRLFVTAGSPARGAEIFRRVLKEKPQDAGALTGLAEAELVAGNFRSATQSFAIASRLRPDDTQLRAQLAASTDALALDPTQRGLGGDEQLRRSRELILRLATDLKQCLSNNPPADVVALIHEAGEVQKGPVRRVKPGEALDKNLQIAEEIGRARQSACRDHKSPDTLTLVLNRLKQ